MRHADDFILNIRNCFQNLIKILRIFYSVLVPYGLVSSFLHISPGAPQYTTDAPVAFIIGNYRYSSNLSINLAFLYFFLFEFNVKTVESIRPKLFEATHTTTGKDSGWLKGNKFTKKCRFFYF